MICLSIYVHVTACSFSSFSVVLVSAGVVILPRMGVGGYQALDGRGGLTNVHATLNWIHQGAAANAIINYPESH